QVRLSCLFPFPFSLLLVKWQDKSLYGTTDNIVSVSNAPLLRCLSPGAGGTHARRESEPSGTPIAPGERVTWTVFSCQAPAFHSRLKAGSYLPPFLCVARVDLGTANLPGLSARGGIDHCLCAGSDIA